MKTELTREVAFVWLEFHANVTSLVKNAYVVRFYSVEQIHTNTIETLILAVEQEKFEMNSRDAIV